RAIASDPTGVWKRLVTDPVDGTLVEHTRHTYRPPAALDDFVRARDHTCRFPGCQRSAQHGDLDHTIPWPKGPTTPGNLGALCRHHHRLKHHTAWRLIQANGRFHWTSPTGRRYLTHPENHNPP
ncbi:MAG TPA: HNH endonuclease signature motif containing protein, partial [Mycobacteriales bacterium]